MDFSKVAKKVFNVSPAMVGKKISTAELLHNVLEIEKVDILNMFDKHGEEKPVSVWNFKGISGHYFGGYMLTKIAKAWFEEYAKEHGGEFDLSEFNKELAETNVKITIEMKRTRNGNNFVSVNFVQ